MTNQHPITPPLELVHQWADMLASRSDQAVFTKAVQWGANQELEECIELLEKWGFNTTTTRLLCATRRPNPPSLKEQAIAALNEIEDHMLGPTNQEKLIRRALEALDD